ncbi:MAG: alpha/beta fold hydrolase, partial [Nitrosopumilus sp.]|nr:alpha/beta fold hydrolase [Nitrosopumilus sp.]
MQKNIKFQNSKINYSITGSGSVVVLLHGFVEDLSIWNDLISVLSKKYKTIAVDLPGHGQSELFSKEVSIDNMAEVVHEVLIAEKAEDIILIGHSMGGYVTMA